MKKERTKLLLSKTKRDNGKLFSTCAIDEKLNSKNFENSSNVQIKEKNIYNSEKSSTGDSTKSKLKSDENDNNKSQIKKKVDDYKIKNEIRKLKNREAAQKSRINKKLEYEIIKNNQILLEQENKNLQSEIDKIKSNIDKLCKDCKNIIYTEVYKNSKFSDNAIGLKLGLENNKKIKFKIVQNNLNFKNYSNINSSNTLSILIKYTVFTGLLMIVCLISNFFWIGGVKEKEDKQIYNSNKPGRILIENYSFSNFSEFYNNNKTFIEESKIYYNSSILEPIQNSVSIKNESIKDSIKKSNKIDNSIYMKFYDYLKYKTGSSIINSNPPKINSNVNLDNLNNKQFLPKKENLQKSNEECKNNRTFFTAVNLKQDNTKSQNYYIEDDNICNATKFKGYFNFDLAKSNKYYSKNSIDNNKTCELCNSKEKIESNNSFLNHKSTNLNKKGNFENKIENNFNIKTSSNYIDREKTNYRK